MKEIKNIEDWIRQLLKQLTPIDKDNIIEYKLVNRVYLSYNKDTESIYFDDEGVYMTIERSFGINYDEIREIIKNVVSSEYNIKIKNSWLK